MRPIQTLFQIRPYVAAIGSELHLVRVAMNFEVFDDLPALVFCQLRPDHAVLWRAAALPAHVSLTEFVPGIRVASQSGVNRESTLAGLRYQPEIRRVEVPRTHPEFLFAASGR